MIFFPINGTGKIGHTHGKLNLNTDFVPSTKINTKWIINLKVKYKTKKFQDHNIKT